MRSKPYRTSSASLRNTPKSSTPRSDISAETSTISYSPARAANIIRKQLGSISRTTVYRMLDDGRIDCVRIGARILIPTKALEEFLNRCKRGERY